MILTSDPLLAGVCIAFALMLASIFLSTCDIRRLFRLNRSKP